MAWRGADTSRHLSWPLCSGALKRDAVLLTPPPPAPVGFHQEGSHISSRFSPGGEQHATDKWWGATSTPPRRYTALGGVAVDRTAAVHGFHLAPQPWVAAHRPAAPGLGVALASQGQARPIRSGLRCAGGIKPSRCRARARDKAQAAAPAQE
jgi:hypothetical protein